MLSKDQALAAADALILKVEAERRKRIERRTSRLVTLYPALKRVPAEEREALMHAAWNSPMTRRVVLATALFAVLAGLWSLFGGVALGIDPGQQRPYALAAAAGALIAPASYLCIRAFLRREVPNRYPKNDEQASRLGA